MKKQKLHFPDSFSVRVQLGLYPTGQIILQKTLIWSYVKCAKQGRAQKVHLGGANPARGNTTQEPRLWQQLPLAPEAASSMVAQCFGVVLEVLPGTPATPTAGKMVPSLGTLPFTPPQTHV